MDDVTLESLTITWENGFLEDGVPRQEPWLSLEGEVVLPAPSGRLVVVPIKTNVWNHDLTAQEKRAATMLLKAALRRIGEHYFGKE